MKETIPPRTDLVFQPFELPCGRVLKNRIVKSAMSDSLGDGRGNPTDTQIRLYERWAEGGVAASIIGEVQINPWFPEKPGNLVLAKDLDSSKFVELARRGSANHASLWLQLGHAGAMAHQPISTPKGPSALEFPELKCAALSRDEIRRLPSEFAHAAARAKALGFGGVQIHAAHGFLLSQFLSPLFNRRDDDYGGSIANRMRLLLEVIEDVRSAVGPGFPVALKLNSSDQLEGGLTQADALKVISALDRTGIDLIDVSGGTYFPGARSASETAGRGLYFLDFARRARRLTGKPIMLTGGFKNLAQAGEAVSDGSVDFVGLARALVLDPDLPRHWQMGLVDGPVFPRFSEPPEGGVTAWYTMRLADIGENRETTGSTDLEAAVAAYDGRDRRRIELWMARFPVRR